ncbi:hypothetical protein BG74_09195 [Sodalis-like endosymbiont of Proechinophthirus fluctus]|nr:hypothetical protein BG74_09195 [Sodalis-like endosymbiont of Proechinophthirus fluctus]
MRGHPAQIVEAYDISECLKSVGVGRCCAQIIIADSKGAAGIDANADMVFIIDPINNLHQLFKMKVQRLLGQRCFL